VAGAVEDERELLPFELFILLIFFILVLGTLPVVGPNDNRMGLFTV
jgi:hypothetical protein